MAIWLWIIWGDRTAYAVDSALTVGNPEARIARWWWFLWPVRAKLPTLIAVDAV